MGKAEFSDFLIVSVLVRHCEPASCGPSLNVPVPPPNQALGWNLFLTFSQG